MAKETRLPTQVFLEKMLTYQAAPQAVPQSVQPVVTSAGLVGKDPEKRIKLLKKKLKQIGDIRMRVAAGETVEMTQMQKLDSENEILKEVFYLIARVF